MALVTCPDCGRQVSDHAVACPRCGRPLRGGTGVPRSSSAGIGMMLAGGIGVIVGSFMPWVRLGPITVSGIDDGGGMTAVIGGFMVALAVVARTTESLTPRVLVGIGSVAAILIAVADANRIADGFSREMVGGGLAVIFLAGLVALVGSFLKAKPRAKPEAI